MAGRPVDCSGNARTRKQRLVGSVDDRLRTLRNVRGAGITVLPGLEEGFIAAGVSERELGNALGVLLPARRV